MLSLTKGEDIFNEAPTRTDFRQERLNEGIADVYSIGSGGPC
jgi:hypothetical protein